MGYRSQTFRDYLINDGVAKDTDPVDFDLREVSALHEQWRLSSEPDASWRSSD
jgi:hypothetical protein